MAYGFGIDPHSSVAPKGSTAFGVKPMTESPIDAARAWSRADQVGSYDNAKRRAAMGSDWTQERSAAGATAARSRIRGTRATARPSITQGKALGGPPEEAEVRGDAGPPRLTSGVAPNFYRDKPYYDMPYGTVGTVASNLARLLTFRPGDDEKERPTIPTNPPELDPGPTRPGLGTGGGPVPATTGPRTPTPYEGPGSPDIYQPPVDAEIVDAIGTTYPALGQEVIDVESWETAGEIGRGRTPGMDRRAQRALGTGNRALEAGDPNAGPNPRLGPPEGFAMGNGGPSPSPDAAPPIIGDYFDPKNRGSGLPTGGEDPLGRSSNLPSRFGGRGSYGFRPMGEINAAPSASNAPEQADVEAAAESYEFGNAYAGEPRESPVGKRGRSRRDAIANYNALGDENQGQIPGMDWGDIDRM